MGLKTSLFLDVFVINQGQVKEALKFYFVLEEVLFCCFTWSCLLVFQV